MAVIKPFLRFYENMCKNRSVCQFMQCNVGSFFMDERAFESPLPLARISIPAQERCTVAIKFDAREQVIDDPLDPFAFEPTDRPFPSAASAGAMAHRRRCSLIISCAIGTQRPQFTSASRAR